MRMLQATNGLMFAFDSSKDVTEYCEKDAGRKYVNAQCRDFIGEGIESWEDAEAKMQEAWLAGMDTLAAFVEKLQNAKLPEIKSHKRKTEFSSEGGDEVDLEKFMAGEAKYFRKSVREESTGDLTVTIFIDTSAPCTTNTDDILWRGAAAIALAHKLEEKGYSTEIWVVAGSTVFAFENTKVMTACCLKRCSDALDISTLVNAVSGWCFRSITFTLWATICKKCQKECDYALGRPVTPNQVDLDLLSTDGNRCYSAGAFSFSAALGIIEGQLEKLAPEKK